MHRVRSVEVRGAKLQEAHLELVRGSTWNLISLIVVKPVLCLLCGRIYSGNSGKEEACGTPQMNDWLLA